MDKKYKLLSCCLAGAALLGGGLVLTGCGAQDLGYTKDEIDNRLDSVDGVLKDVDQSLGDIDEALGDIDQSLDNIVSDMVSSSAKEKLVEKILDVKGLLLAADSIGTETYYEVKDAAGIVRESGAERSVSYYDESSKERIVYNALADDNADGVTKTLDVYAYDEENGYRVDSYDFLADSTSTKYVSQIDASCGANLSNVIVEELIDKPFFHYVNREGFSTTYAFVSVKKLGDDEFSFKVEVNPEGQQTQNYVELTIKGAKITSYEKTSISTESGEYLKTNIKVSFDYDVNKDTIEGLDRLQSQKAVQVALQKLVDIEDEYFENPTTYTMVGTSIFEGEQQEMTTLYDAEKGIGSVDGFVKLMKDEKGNYSMLYASGYVSEVEEEDARDFEYNYLIRSAAPLHSILGRVGEMGSVSLEELKVAFIEGQVQAMLMHPATDIVWSESVEESETGFSVMLEAQFKSDGQDFVASVKCVCEDEKITGYEVIITEVATASAFVNSAVYTHGTFDQERYDGFVYDRSAELTYYDMRSLEAKLAEKPISFSLTSSNGGALTADFENNIAADAEYKIIKNSDGTYSKVTVEGAVTVLTQDTLDEEMQKFAAMHSGIGMLTGKDATQLSYSAFKEAVFPADEMIELAYGLSVESKELTETFAETEEEKSLILTMTYVGSDEETLEMSITISFNDEMYTSISQTVTMQGSSQSVTMTYSKGFSQEIYDAVEAVPLPTEEEAFAQMVALASELAENPIDYTIAMTSGGHSYYSTYDFTNDIGIVQGNKIAKNSNGSHFIYNQEGGTVDLGEEDVAYVRDLSIGILAVYFLGQGDSESLEGLTYQQFKNSLLPSAEELETEYGFVEQSREVTCTISRNGKKVTAAYVATSRAADGTSFVLEYSVSYNEKMFTNFTQNLIYGSTIEGGSMTYVEGFSQQIYDAFVV